MKKSMIAVFAVALIAVAIVNVNAATKGEKGIIVGSLVELTSYAMIEGDNVEAAKDRAEKGFPVGIIEDDTNTIWLLTFRSSAPASHLEVANDHVADYIGMKVVIQGLKYERNGVNVVRFSSISEY
ncbi:MAG: hypothetical protein VCD00_03095 [Candidatus Hydrogenedentota bacterium]